MARLRWHLTLLVLVFTPVPVLIANRVAPRRKRWEKILLDEILILDEATSTLDAETESQVQEALERLVRGRTTFVIAHRPATVVNADRILVRMRGLLVACKAFRRFTVGADSPRVTPGIPRRLCVRHGRLLVSASRRGGRSWR